jgi:putative radical SAM enzyme (TIGR03279 family)
LRVDQVHSGSPAAKAGIRPGDRLERIQGEPVLDEIDYQYLTAGTALRLDVRRGDVPLSLRLRKRAGAPLGLTFRSALMTRPRRCTNRCMFCFVDQLPPGLRPSLYVKDDDWRLSLKTGNFITLTNLPEKELNRIIARRASPLYLSVHTTDGALRQAMLGNPKADRILGLLRRFAEAGLCFHCQIVLCPGINDGEALGRTLADLYALYPATRSVALVPVGLTRYRDGLPALRPYTPAEAAQVLNAMREWQRRALAERGTRLVFAADEFYQIAGRPLPPSTDYEDYPQLENGVGLLRQFADGFEAAARLGSPCVRPRQVALATGVSAAPFLTALTAAHPLTGVSVDVRPIINRFFGETVTVAGLVTGGDLLAQLAGLRADELLLPACMLRAGEDVFLDGVPLTQISKQLGVPVRVVPPGGGDLRDALAGLEA